MRYAKTTKEMFLRTRRIPLTSEEQAFYNLAIAKPCDACLASVAVARTYLHDIDQEHFISMPLNAGNRPLGMYLVSLGGPSECQVDVRQVFRTAIHIGAVGLVVAHNHPSGDLLPSVADLSLTRRIVSAANLLGIGFLDHLIVGPIPDGTGHYSIREHHDELFKRPDGLE